MGGCLADLRQQTCLEMTPGGGKNVSNAPPAGAKLFGSKRSLGKNNGSAAIRPRQPLLSFAGANLLFDGLLPAPTAAKRSNGDRLQTWSSVDGRRFYKLLSNHGRTGLVMAGRQTMSFRPAPAIQWQTATGPWPSALG